tara:strand:+ start:16519 stop:16803 length:285 start_codon:yes stop_codon:yes gene_type:complete
LQQLKFWAIQGRRSKPEKVKALAKVKSITAERNRWADADTISVIATTRGRRLALILLRVDNRARLSQLPVASCQLPSHEYKKARCGSSQIMKII